MIGIFGSAFNPPTLGHKSAIIQASQQCEKILLVPSASHAFGKTMLPYEIRYHLLQAFAQDIADELTCEIEVSTIEQEMHNQGMSPIYTFDVLEQLAENYPDQTLAFIMGPDNAIPETWAKFYKHEIIDQRWHKIVCKEQQPIRSTHVRNALIDKTSDETLLSLVTPSVLSIIKANRLYL